MDRPPFRQCLELTAAADADWRDLTATLAVDLGVDVWTWSARLLLDVVALLQRRAAARSSGTPDGRHDAAAAALASARAERATAPDGGASWGTVGPDELARILRDS